MESIQSSAAMYYAKSSPNLIRLIITRYLFPDSVHAISKKISLTILLDSAYKKEKINRRISFMSEKIIWAQFLRRIYNIDLNTLITISIYENKSLEQLCQYENNFSQYISYLAHLKTNGIELPNIPNSEKLLEFGKNYRRTPYFSGEIIVNANGILCLRDPYLDK